MRAQGEGNGSVGLGVRSHPFSSSEILDGLSYPLNYNQNVSRVSTRYKREFHFTVGYWLVNLVKYCGSY